MRRDGCSVHVAPPAQRLLAFLALHRSSAGRKVITATLWADLDERQGAARLRSTLWRLPSAGADKLVEADGLRLRLADHVDVDVRMAESDRRACELNVRQLCGDILTEWTDEWVDIEREHFRQLRLRRLEELSEQALSRRQYGVALQAALAAVALEPLRESAHRRAMQVHLAEENPSEALRQYDIVRRSLREELGLAPSAATRAVVANLLGRPLDAVA